MWNCSDIFAEETGVIDGIERRGTLLVQRSDIYFEEANVGKVS